MHYEAILLDPEHGHHKRGVGPTPVQAITIAFRKILKGQLEEQNESQADNFGPTEAMQCFLMVGTEDEYYESPKTIKEDVNALQVVVRMDRTKEAMYIPCGFVRPVF